MYKYLCGMTEQGCCCCKDVISYEGSKKYLSYHCDGSSWQAVRGSIEESDISHYGISHYQNGWEKQGPSKQALLLQISQWREAAGPVPAEVSCREGNFWMRVSLGLSRQTGAGWFRTIKTPEFLMIASLSILQQFYLKVEKLAAPFTQDTCWFGQTAKQLKAPFGPSNGALGSAKGMLTQQTGEPQPS